MYRTLYKPLRNRCFIHIFLASLVAMAAAAESSDSGGPIIDISPTTLTYGEVSPQDTPEKTIEITNNGDESLAIDKIASSCFCTVVKTVSLVVAPGDTATIPVKLDLAEYGSNTIKSYVTLRSNAVNEPVARVEVTGTVIPEVLVEPAEIDFGTVKRGQAVSKAVFIRRNNVETFEALNITAPEGLAAAGREVDGDYAVVVEFTPGDDSSRLNSDVIVETNIGRTPEIRIPVRANVVGVECTLEPKVVVFEKGRPGDAVGIVEVVGTHDLRVLEAQCSTDAFRAEVETIEENKRHRITVFVTDKAVSGDTFGTLHLRVQEGKLIEPREVTVFGTIE
jgi:hypothetical protein